MSEELYIFHMKLYYKRFCYDIAERTIIPFDFPSCVDVSSDVYLPHVRYALKEWKFNVSNRRAKLPDCGTKQRLAVDEKSRNDKSRNYMSRKRMKQRFVAGSSQMFQEVGSELEAANIMMETLSAEFEMGKERVDAMEAGMWEWEAAMEARMREREAATEARMREREATMVARMKERVAAMMARMREFDARERKRDKEMQRMWRQVRALTQQLDMSSYPSSVKKSCVASSSQAVDELGSELKARNNMIDTLSAEIKTVKEREVANEARMRERQAAMKVRRREWEAAMLAKMREWDAAMEAGMREPEAAMEARMREPEASVEARMREHEAAMEARIREWEAAMEARMREWEAAMEARMREWEAAMEARMREREDAMEARMREWEAAMEDKEARERIKVEEMQNMQRQLLALTQQPDTSSYLSSEPDDEPGCGPSD